jgi:hypothetical protein
MCFLELVEHVRLFNPSITKRKERRKAGRKKGKKEERKAGCIEIQVLSKLYKILFFLVLLWEIRGQ